jgi:predicted TIM-barrel fold metal-dependent hydrolase
MVAKTVEYSVVETVGSSEMLLVDVKVLKMAVWSADWMVALWADYLADLKGFLRVEMKDVMKAVYLAEMWDARKVAWKDDYLVALKDERMVEHLAGEMVAM